MAGPCCRKRSAHGCAHCVHMAGLLSPPHPCSSTTNGNGPGPSGRMMVTGSDPCAARAPRSSAAPAWKLAALPGRHGTCAVSDEATPAVTASVRTSAADTVHLVGVIEGLPTDDEALSIR